MFHQSFKIDSIGNRSESKPVMDKYVQECFSVPIFPLLTEEEQDYVIKSLLKVLNA